MLFIEMRSFVRTSLELEVCGRNGRSAFELHLRTVLSEASVLIERMIKSARKLVVHPP